MWRVFGLGFGFCFISVLGLFVGYGLGKENVMKTGNRGTMDPAIRVHLDASIKDDRELVVKTKYTNISHEPVYVFNQRPLWIRTWMSSEVDLVSVMPELTEWMEVFAPVVPPVKLLQPKESLSGSFSYSLPLKDDFPYPAGPVMEMPVPIKKIVSRKIVLYVGYFKASDKVKLFDVPESDEQVPGYYDVKQQIVVKSSSVTLEIPMLCPGINVKNSSNPNLFE